MMEDFSLRSIEKLMADIYKTYPPDNAVEMRHNAPRMEERIIKYAHKSAGLPPASIKKPKPDEYYVNSFNGITIIRDDSLPEGEIQMRNSRGETVRVLMWVEGIQSK